MPQKISVFIFTYTYNSVNILHFHLPLQNHWANFNEIIIWLSESKYVQSKGYARFHGEIITKMRKKHC